MIVFSGPTVGPFRSGLEWSRLGDPSQEPMWIVQHPEPKIKPIELSKQKQVNLSDLANVSVEILCRLQELYQNNSDDEWVWELSDVNISDIVTALGLDGYVALSDVIVLPVWFKILMTVLFIGCLIWASISNLRMLFAIGTHKSSWSSTNILIGALALSDLLTCCCTTPTEVSLIIYDLSIWNFGKLGCVVFPFLQSAAILSNALILCLIAYDRYVCVVKMQPKTVAKPGWPIIASILAAWIISIGVALPAFWLWRVYYFIVVDDIPDPEIGMDFCSVFPSCMDNKALGPLTFPIYHVVLCGCIFVPLFLLFVVLYGRIGHFLWVRSPIGTGDSNVHLAKKKRIALALFWLVFWFFFCRMPNWIFVMVTMFQENEKATSGLLMTKNFLVFLSVLNTVVNPWLYSQLNEPLKKTMKNCSDKFCGQFSIFKSCYCCLASNVREQTPSPKQKVGLHRQNEKQQSIQERPERRRISQVEPMEMEEELGATRLSPVNNDAPVFTVQADLTRSTSKNGKTRQTTVLTLE